VLEERLVRMGISVYGYLKGAGAVVCAQQRKEMIGPEEALNILLGRMWRVYDPLNWRIDVKKRVDAIERGEW
jgi:hypothetical protein